jgi:transposase InsO family protein
MDMIQMDLIAGMPKAETGHCHILTIIDIATGYTWFIPLKTNTILEVALHRMAIEHQFGQANIIHTDNGTELKNPLMTNITALFKIDNRHGTAYYPQGHGTVERKTEISPI